MKNEEKKKSKEKCEIFSLDRKERIKKTSLC